ncbi:hypothetical protein BDR26DRAFT_803673 [Obelidium mucronatum]|nr:hypothetical protein BDR26DRAFT_803673 [Obelidium mucronatum]
MSELTKKLLVASAELENSAPKNYSVIAGFFFDGVTPIKQLFLNASIKIGSEAFLRQLKYVDDESVAECRQRIAAFETQFVKEASENLEKIATVGVNLIKDGAVILIHSFSRVVMVLLERAAKLNRRYSVIVTESRPSHNGQKSVDALKKLGVPVKLIPDSAVGFVMEKVDMVLVGAEAVVENGGLINQMGTYQIALVAKAAHKPFYSVTETHKFLHMFPLSQTDVELQEHKIDQDVEGASNYSFVSAHHVDYTPPQLVTSLITNFGVLTPSGVVHLLIS